MRAAGRRRPGPAGQPPVPATLYLVSPNGYRDALYNWPAGQDNWTILASCVAPGTAASRLWLVPASGATPAATNATQIPMRAPSGIQGVVADIPYNQGS